MNNSLKNVGFNEVQNVYGKWNEKKIDILSPLEYICSFKKSDCVHTTTDKSESWYKMNKYSCVFPYKLPSNVFSRLFKYLHVNSAHRSVASNFNLIICHLFIKWSIETLPNISLKYKHTEFEVVPRDNYVNIHVVTIGLLAS